MPAQLVTFVLHQLTIRVLNFMLLITKVHQLQTSQP